MNAVPDARGRTASANPRQRQIDVHVTTPPPTASSSLWSHHPQNRLISALLCLALIITPLVPLLAMAAWWRHETTTPYLSQGQAAAAAGGAGDFKPGLSFCARSPLDSGKLLSRTWAARHPAVICMLQVLKPAVE